MRSNWYNEELQKAISGYRETIGSLENIKKDVQPWDRSELWWDQLERQIQHLKQSIASLEDYVGTASIRPENRPSPRR
jgi:hypothetical protein